jgi:hypothetical protein
MHALIPPSQLKFFIRKRISVKTENAIKLIWIHIDIQSSLWILKGTFFKWYPN